MKASAAVIAMFALANAGSAAAGRPVASDVASPVTEHAMRHMFQKWVLKHNKQYAGDEFESRLKIFHANHKFVTETNAAQSDYVLELNKFADLTGEEFAKGFLGGKPENFKHAAGIPFTHADVELSDDPEVVDWRQQNAVSEVKNQGQCGSCWAFSTTGSIEGAHAIATGELVTLSEQELVDCDTTQDHGCNGGLMDYAFEFAEAHGLASEDAYPYTAAPGQCNTAAEGKPVATITSYSDVPQGDETALRKAVKQQPVSVAIEADQQAFQLYKSGVFTSMCGTNLDHGVLAVGYSYNPHPGLFKSEGYWIVKNSWGADWGEEGYIRLKMGDNKCGIANSASYPVV